MRRRRMNTATAMHAAGTCPACRGAGQAPLQMPYGLWVRPCAACDGTGSSR
jgi:DnaJ-class molecular chaperone